MSRMLSKMNLISVVQKLPKEDIETIQGYVEMIEEENQELKKQLEEKENIACDWKDSCLENAGKIEILETQQKVFINYLENELLDARYYARDIAHFIEYVLQKYKKLIGVSDEKTN